MAIRKKIIDFFNLFDFYNATKLGTTVLLIVKVISKSVGLEGGVVKSYTSYCISFLLKYNKYKIEKVGDPRVSNRFVCYENCWAKA